MKGKEGRCDDGSKSVEGINERLPNEEMLLERQFLVFASVLEP